MVRIGLVRRPTFCTKSVQFGVSGYLMANESCAKSALSTAGCRIIVGTDPALYAVQRFFIVSMCVGRPARPLLGDGCYGYSARRPEDG